MFSADPALNHSTCSGLKVCFASNSIFVPSGLGDHALHVLVGNRRKVEHADAVVFADLVVRVGIGEGERHEALLLQVGFVDACERTGEDHDAAAEAWLHRRVFT